MSKYLQKIKKIGPYARKLLMIAFVFYVVFFGFLVLFQRVFLYFPNDHYITPDQAGMSSVFEELAVKTEDGIALKGWLAKADAGKPTIVFFHGNADSVRKMSFVAQLYTPSGYGFLVTEYRGYSGFGGVPTEEGLYKDARAFVRSLMDKGVDEDDIILAGHSLGTGVATQMATEFNVGGLMLLAPLLSVKDMASARLPFFPTKYFVWDQFDNGSKIVDIDMPLFIMHGSWDVIIPFSQGAELYERAHDPKTFMRVERGGHNNLFTHPFVPASMEWLKAIRR